MLRILTAILFLSLSQPVWAENACFAPHADLATLNEEISNELFEAAVDSIQLQTALLVKTDQVSDASSQWTEIKLALMAAKSKLENNIDGIDASEAKNLMEMYFMGTRSLAQSALHIMGPHNPFLDEYKIKLSVRSYLRILPTGGRSIDGTSASIKGDTVLLGHSTETVSAVHVESTVRVQRKDRAKQYYEASRCVLARAFIQNIKGTASILNEKTKLRLGNLEACNGLKLQSLVKDNRSLDFEEQRRSIRKNIKGGPEYLDANDYIQLQGVIIEEDSNIDFILIRGALGDEAENIAALNEKYIEVETELFSDEEWFAKAVSLGPQLALIIKDKLNTCSREVSLNKFDLVFQRLVAFKLQEMIANSNLMANSLNVQDRKAQLKEALVYALSNLAELAATSELTLTGQLNTLEAIYFFNNVAAAVKSHIAQSDIIPALVERIEAALDAVPEDDEETHRKILDGFVQLEDAAKEMHEHTSPYTLTSNLEFKPSAIAKLFDGELGSLTGDFYYHADQIFTRKDHEERRKSWAAAQEFLRADSITYGYECKSLGFLSNANIMLKGLVFLSPSQKQNRQKQCETVTRFAEHLGLMTSKEPENLGDVWASFVKHYGPDNHWFNKEKEIKGIEQRYREYLTITWANVFPVLDVSLDKLNLDFQTQWKKVYDIVATESDRDLIESVLERALRYTMANAEMELLLVLAASDISQLHEPFIKDMKVLNRLFGSGPISEYEYASVDAALGITQGKTMYPSMYDYHSEYQAKIVNDGERAIRQRKDAVHKLTLPMIYMTGIWAFRGLMSYTPARAASAGLYTLGQTSALITGAYFNALNWIFAAGLVHAYSWDKQLAKTQARLDELKQVDGIPDRDHQIVEYNTYYTKKTKISVDRGEARTDMIWYGAFTAFNVALYFAEPALMTRYAMKSQRTTSLTEANAKRLKDSWKIRKAWLANRLYSDKIKLRGPLKRLGLKKIPDLATLQNARRISQDANAAEDYYRVVSLIGQRASSNMGRADLEAKMAKSLFGNERKVSELHRYAAELQRIRPDGVIGRLR